MVAKLLSPSRSALLARAAVVTLGASVALVAGLPVPAASADVAVTLYASPEVADGSGRSCTTVEAACSLFDARDKVRTLNGDMTGDIVVELLGGTYELPSTFSLAEGDTVHDSGTNGYDVVYENYDTDIPTLSGGRTITGWTLSDSAKGIYSAPAPSGVDSRQLYVNGVRQVRARGELPGTWTETTSGADITGNPVSTYKNLTGVELVNNHLWMQPRCPIASATSTTVTMAQPCWKNVNEDEWQDFQRPDWVENAYEVLDQPGEWYLDRTGAVAGNGSPRIYYKPTDPATLATSKVVLPVLQTLMSATGTSTNRLHNLQFKGIHVEYGTWTWPDTPEGYAPEQSGYLHYGDTGSSQTLNLYRTPGNVDVQEATSIRFEGDTFARLGGVGLSLMKGTQDITVLANRFEDISSSAVSIGHINDHHPDGESEYVRNVSFTNNLVTRAGAEYQDASAITAAYPQYTDISYNEIYDLPYTGISIGWGWGRTDAYCTGQPECLSFTTPTPAQNNSITHNYVHDYMKDIEDGGGIYTQGAQPDSVISDNYLVNDHWFFTYLDEGTAGYTVTNNVMQGLDQYVRINFRTHDNRATGNYADRSGSSNSGPGSNVISGNFTGLDKDDWPEGARSVIDGAGIWPWYSGVKLTDLALNATATASSSVGATWAPSFAVDGRVRTTTSPTHYTQRWLTGPGFPRTLSLDLGRPYALSSIKQTTSETDGSSSSYKLEGSVDTSSWVTLADHTGEEVPNGTSDDVSGTYRYVRLTVTGVANGHWASSNELEVWGSVPWDAAHTLRTRISTSSETATGSGLKAFDGRLETAWTASGTGYPQLISVDMDRAFPLRVVRQVVADPDATRQYRYKIEGSNNNAQWTMLADRQVDGRTGPVLEDVVSGTYRWVRVSVMGSTSTRPVGLNDVQVLVD